MWLFQKLVKNLPQVEWMLRFVVLSPKIKCLSVCNSEWELKLVCHSNILITHMLTCILPTGVLHRLSIGCCHEEKTSHLSFTY